MKHWQVSLQDILILILLIAISLFLMRIESRAAVLGFLPGSYVMAAMRRGNVQRTWSDFFIRVAYCSVGGAFSLCLLVILTLVIASLDRLEPLPSWFIAVLIAMYGIAGAGLGAVYGGLESVVLWRKSTCCDRDR